MPFYAIHCIDRAAAGDLRQRTRDEHLAYLDRFAPQILVGGPLLDRDGTPLGSLLILDFPERRDAYRFAADDPYSLAGLFQSVAITQWRRTFPATLSAGPTPPPARPPGVDRARANAISDRGNPNMMRLTNLADYAVVVMTEAARCDDCASATRIATKTGLPAPTAAKLLNALARAGLLVSTRGAGGGFRLARGADAITLADIVEAVDGPIALTACVAHVEQTCEIQGSCTAASHWPGVNDAVRGALAAVTLGQLAARRETV